MRALARMGVAAGRSVVWVGLGVGLGGGSACGQAASVEFILHDDARIEAVSGDGSVLVGWSLVGRAWWPCRWTREWGVQRLEGLPGLVGGEAWGLTPGGSCIVGVFWDGPVGGRGFRWRDRGDNRAGSAWGDAVALEDLAGGGIDAWALCVSADETVIGGCGSPDLRKRAVEWVGAEPGLPVRVGDPPGAVPGASVQDLSRDGRVAVGVQNVIRGGRAETRAFRWVSGAGVQDLGVRVATFDGAIPARRVRCSADGSVVVGTAYEGAAARGFRWTAGGGLEMIPAPDPAFPTSAFVGVSDDGEVLTGSMAHSGGVGPALWTRRAGLVLVRDFLVARGADVPGDPRWHLTEATAISGDGRMVVGNGNDAALDDTAWWLADLGWRRADLDRDDFTDFFDYSLFVERYESGSVLADFNHDGVVDGRDAADFTAAFEAGR